MGPSTLTVLFDVDGTLLDVRARHHRLYAELVRTRGGDPLSPDRYWSAKTDAVPWRTILDASALGAGDEAAFLSAFADQIEDPERLEADTVVDGILTVLAELRPRAELGAISLRRHHESLVGQLRHLGLAECFARVDSAAGHRDARAEKHRLIATWRAGAGRAGPLVVVGDTEVDVLAARDAEVSVVAVTWGLRSIDRLRWTPADGLVETPADLLTVIDRVAHRDLP